MRRSPLFDSVTQPDATDRTPAGEGSDLVDVSATIDHRQLYRLPWSLPDNAIAWLEPTKKCNLACLGCYRENDPRGHKTLEEVRHDLEVFQRFRTVDGVSIAGGDPLVHPRDRARSSRMVARGRPEADRQHQRSRALTEELLGELKGAGVAGFTFHIDSKQGRPGWKDSNEIELCELRQHYAEMVAAAGGIGCSFNATVYEDTLRYVPEVVGSGRSATSRSSTRSSSSPSAPASSAAASTTTSGASRSISPRCPTRPATRRRTRSSRPTSSPRSASASRTSRPPPT